MGLLRARGRKQPRQEAAVGAVVGTARRVSAAFPEGQEKQEFIYGNHRDSAVAELGLGRWGSGLGQVDPRGSWDRLIQEELGQVDPG